MTNEALATVFKDLINRKPIAQFLDVNIQLDEKLFGIKLNLN